MDEKLFEALHYILEHSKPHRLEVECLAEFVETVSSPHFDGDYTLAATGALYEWDI